MRSKPLGGVRVEARRPRVAAGGLLPLGLQQGDGGRGEDAPCWVGGVGGGRVGHQLDFALQLDQPRQDVVQ